MLYAAIILQVFLLPDRAFGTHAPPNRGRAGLRVLNELDGLYYKSAEGEVHGPFKRSQVETWWRQGYFPAGMNAAVHLPFSDDARPRLCSRNAICVQPYQFQLGQLGLSRRWRRSLIRSALEITGLVCAVALFSMLLFFSRASVYQT